MLGQRKPLGKQIFGKGILNLGMRGTPPALQAAAASCEGVAPGGTRLDVGAAESPMWRIWGCNQGGTKPLPAPEEDGAPEGVSGVAWGLFDQRPSCACASGRRDTNTTASCQLHSLLRCGFEAGQSGRAGRMAPIYC